MKPTYEELEAERDALAARVLIEAENAVMDKYGIPQEAQ